MKEFLKRFAYSRAQITTIPSQRTENQPNSFNIVNL